MRGGLAERLCVGGSLCPWRDTWSSDWRVLVPPGFILGSLVISLINPSGRKLPLPKSLFRSFADTPEGAHPQVSPLESPTNRTPACSAHLCRRLYFQKGLW